MPKSIILWKTQCFLKTCSNSHFCFISYKSVCRFFIQLELIMLTNSPRDGIGRHAWLKTTSQWGPGSSPGVGTLFSYLNKICTFIMFSSSVYPNLYWSRTLILFSARWHRLYLPSISLWVFLILVSSSLFLIPDVPSLVLRLTTAPSSNLDLVTIIFTHELISESALTALLSHAAFFYLISSVVFLIPVFIFY